MTPFLSLLLLAFFAVLYCSISVIVICAAIFLCLMLYDEIRERFPKSSKKL